MTGVLVMAAILIGVGVVGGLGLPVFVMRNVIHEVPRFSSARGLRPLNSRLRVASVLVFNSEAGLQRVTSLLVRAMCLGLMRTRDTSLLFLQFGRVRAARCRPSVWSVPRARRPGRGRHPRADPPEPQAVGL
ncbi:MAG TPA: hypothetical protein VE569_13525, partial [Acidimicrobiia bacterium]|nr:hypothetical protein [Acidimicrobiia bacterium]